MGSLGVPELIVIFLIIVLLFGGSRLPLIGKGLGEGIRNFRKGLRGGEEGPDNLEDGKHDAR
jgi:sec-independent protein translocase protein TatA